MLRGRAVVCPDDGLPNADAVMERGVLLPLSHAIDDATMDFVLETLADFSNLSSQDVPEADPRAGGHRPSISVPVNLHSEFRVAHRCQPTHSLSGCGGDDVPGVADEHVPSVKRVLQPAFSCLPLMVRPFSVPRSRIEARRNGSDGGGRGHATNVEDVDAIVGLIVYPDFRLIG